MTNQPANQTVVVRFIADTQDVIARAKNFRAEVDQMKESIRTAAQQGKQSFKDLEVAMQAAAKVRFTEQIEDLKQGGAKGAQYRESLAAIQAQAKQTSGAIGQAFSELNKETGSLTGGFGILGQAIGTALGLGTVQIIGKIIGAIRGLINELAQAAEQGYQFSKSMFQVEVGVNALRRAGTDITFTQVMDQLEGLKTKFGIFSKTELVQGAAAFLNLNRSMGFTRDELFQLQESVATLAVVNGRSMEEVQRTVALALSSGYTEGLQRLGVSINRVNIAEKAAQLGYADSYMALTELQRAEATRILILEKTAVYAEDLLKYQETTPGKIDAITASIKDLNTETGLMLQPIKLLGQEIKLLWTQMKNWAVENSLIVFLLTELSTEVEHVKSNGVELNPVFKEIVGIFIKINNESEGTIEFFMNLVKYWGELNDLAEKWLNLGKTGFNFPVKEKWIKDETESTEPPIGTPETPALNQDQIQAVEDTAKRILELQADYDNDRRDLEIDLQRDLARIEAEGQEKLEDLAAKHAQKMLDIAYEGKADLDKLQSDYDLDVKQTWDRYYNNLETTNQKHNNKLLKIEEDYQEKLRRIKEGFLMDLEDALHERDARQILTLIKRYNLERTQAKRERDQNKTEEGRAYQEQLDEMRRQRDLRLKEMKEEFLKRYSELLNQMNRELALEVEAYTHKKLQQEEENKKDVEDRKLRYEQDLEDLKLHLEDRLRELATSMSEEVQVTADGMEDVLKILVDTLGPGGNAEKVYKYYLQMVAAYMSAAAQASTMYQTFLPIVTTPNTGPHAQGGMEIANKRTTAVFGEAGPELALFVPLRGGSLNAATTPTVTKIPQLATGGKEKMQIELMLSPGIEARIVDKALDDVADVIIRRLR